MNEFVESQDNTYWDNCTWDSIYENQPPWILKYVEGKGNIAIATRKFRIGEKILQERPLTWTLGSHPFTTMQVEDIKNNISILSKKEKDAFFNLANVFHEYNECAGIYMSNSFDMVNSPIGDACGMYVAIARLNHSCIPNVQQTHIPESKLEVLYATRTIEIGDEINDCYLDLRQSVEDRRCYLEQHYRFTCGCSGCVQAIASSPSTDCNRRQRAKSLVDIIIELSESGHVSDAYDIAMELLRLVSDSRSVGWGERYVAEAHTYICHIALEMENFEDAKKHAKKAYEWNLLLQGSDSYDTKASVELLLKCTT